MSTFLWSSCIIRHVIAHVIRFEVLEDNRQLFISETAHSSKTRQSCVLCTVATTSSQVVNCLVPQTTPISFRITRCRESKGMVMVAKTMLARHRLHCFGPFYYSRIVPGLWHALDDDCCVAPHRDAVTWTLACFLWKYIVLLPRVGVAQRGSVVVRVRIFVCVCVCLSVAFKNVLAAAQTQSRTCLMRPWSCGCRH